MAYTNCFYCHGALRPGAMFCPNCGKPVGITAEMLERAKNGDPQALNDLYLCTYQTVYNHIQVKVKSRETAEDIAQDTYLKVFSNLDQIRDAAAFPGWVLSIAHRTTATWYRNNAQESKNVAFSQMDWQGEDSFSDADDALLGEELNRAYLPEEAMDASETSRLVREILDTLPEDQRIIVSMRIYDGMKFQDIAQVLGIPVSTVKSRFASGMDKIEAKVRDLERRGTKLYSLAPLPFLLALLRRMESQISAPSLQQLLSRTSAAAGASAASASSGAGTAAGKAAGSAVGKAGGAAAARTAGSVGAKAAGKGLAVKLTAILAAAVLVCGAAVGGTLALRGRNTPALDVEPQETAEQIQEQIHVNADDYVTISVEGRDGEGTAAALFDEDRFLADWDGTLQLTQAGEERCPEGEDGVQLLLSALSGSLDRTSGLSNGDRITYVWTLEADEIDSWFSNLDLNCSGLSYTVSGLEEWDTFDAFQGVSVVFSGIAPNGTASLELEDSSLSSLDYVLSAEDGLSNGDVVTVSIQEESAEELRQERGIVPETMTKEFLVSGLPQYVTSLDQISQEALEQMVQVGVDYQMGLMAEEDIAAKIRMDSMDFLGCYFLSLKEAFTPSSSLPSNQIYLIFELNQTVYNVDTDRNEANFPLDYWWYIKFENVMLLEDGTVSIDDTDYEVPHYENVFGWTSGNGFVVDAHYIDSDGVYRSREFTVAGFRDMDDMFKTLVTSQIEQYTYVSTVGSD